MALVIFGIALTGLVPHAVMYTKHLKRLEDRFEPGVTYYLVPSTDLWARKLGAKATITTIDPGALPPPASDPVNNDVAITSVERTLTGEDVTVHVTVQAAL